MPEQASHLSGKKSTEDGRDCRFKGKLTWLSFPLAKGFHSGRENPALFARTLHPFLPLSTMPLATPPGTPRPSPTWSPALLASPAPVPTLPAPPAVPGPSRPAPPPPPPRAPPLTQALTARLGTVSPEVRKLHGQTVRGRPRGSSERRACRGLPLRVRSATQQLRGAPRPAPSSPPPSTGYRSPGACRPAAPTPPPAGARALTSSRRAGPPRVGSELRAEDPRRVTHAWDPASLEPV